MSIIGHDTININYAISSYSLTEDDVTLIEEGSIYQVLDTVILASPKSDVEQSVGRVFRKKACDREFHPLIIDLQDNFSMFEKQCGKRLSLYKKSNFTIFHNGEEIKKRARKKKEEVVLDEFALIDDD